MFTILLHSSKTMRTSRTPTSRQPALIEKTRELARSLMSLSVEDIERIMKLSSTKATETHALIHSWSDDPDATYPAIDSFIGDIYSGLQVASFSEADRAFADEHLLILSGLYGAIRPLDGIVPYRLEMGYKLTGTPEPNLYKFWDDLIAGCIPAGSDIINLSAVEYTKAVLPHLPNARVITPKFLTVSPKTGEPLFVTVHAKIARGAFAHWLIKRHSHHALQEFTELGYSYDASVSSETVPVFVCQTFGGLGLSVRLQK